MTTPTKTQVRKTIGRGAFTSLDFAAKAEVSRATARKRIAALLDAGVIEQLPDTAKVLDAEGKPQRGRPRTQFRVQSGK
jgi:predicted ArsR family transcriptional regulator